MARLWTHTLLIGYVSQIPIAISFGETEFYGMIRGAGGLLGLADPCLSIRDCWRGHFQVLEFATMGRHLAQHEHFDLAVSVAPVLEIHCFSSRACVTSSFSGVSRHLERVG